MNRTLLIVIVFAGFLTCCARAIYVSVPESPTDTFNWPFGIQPFTCVNCPNKYSTFIKEEIHISNNRLQWNPLSEKELENTSFLLTIHNTIKRLGYNNFLSKDLYHEKFEPFIDSLIEWKAQKRDTANYYYKFWQRRRAQMNDDAIWTILNEVKSIYETGNAPVDENLVNPDLLQTLNLDLQMVHNNYDDQPLFFQRVFEHLKEQKKYAEAYTLLHRPVAFDELGFNQLEWLQQLPIDSSRRSYSGGIDTTTSLGHFDRNGKWHDEHLFWLDYPGP